jgi:hypothetical protein
MTRYFSAGMELVFADGKSRVISNGGIRKHPKFEAAEALGFECGLRKFSDVNGD